MPPAGSVHSLRTTDPNADTPNRRAAPARWVDLSRELAMLASDENWKWSYFFAS
jgi:hypothetical protein